MTRLIAIFIILLPIIGKGQSAFSNLDSTVAHFYRALEEPNDDQRLQLLENLFLAKAQINAITVDGQSTPSYATGGLDEFFESTKSFYSQYQFIYDELDRDLNYYANLASINSYVFQKLKRVDSSKSYEQFLWFSIDLMYRDNRWWIVSASWINETELSSIRSAMAEDTLWHDLSR